MAGMVSARPLSQILPHDFDLFPESPTPIEQRFQSPPSPRPQRRSHYRPFSTLYTESPYIELDDKPTRLKRSSSVGGLQAFPTMGINFIGKDKSKSKKDSPRLSPNISEFGESVSKVSTPLKLKLMKSPDLQRPSTSTGLTRPSPTLELPRLKKKRSMASLFSSSDSTAGSGITPESVVAHSPLSGHHVITPPPRSEYATAIKTSGTNKAVTFKEHTVDLDAPDIFVPKGIWAKRHNMTLHPYRGEVPYMQAYEPVLLESDRYTDLLLQRLSHGQPSFHDFGKKPPATALDLGCGRGHWIIHAANVWKNTQITGFDLVDIPLAAFESTENAHFVQGNFLDFKLPFPDKSFEYVRMANLVLCIPKKKWEAVFAEARRVLTPGGRLEVIDDEMHFPYGQTPEPDNNRSMGPILSYMDEDAENDTCDGDTLQGEESAETESTLVSDEGSRRSSFNDKQTKLTESPTVRPLDATSGAMSEYLPPTPNYAMPRTPDVFKHHKYPPVSRSYSSETRYMEFVRQSYASRDLEKSFRLMLRLKYGISPRPADHIVQYLQNVFGEEAAGKKFSFHVKLAPADSPIGAGARGAEATEKDDATVMKSTGAASSLTEGKRIPWIDWEKQKKKKDSKDKKDSKEKKKNPAANNGDAANSESSSERSSFENPAIASTPLPASLNAKAAARLGLPAPMTAKAAERLGLNLDPDMITPRKDKTPSPPLPAVSLPTAGKPSTPVPIQRPSTPVIVSAKAAGRLGISYSALTAAMRDEKKSSNLVQSPGLLVWPSTYIAMSPLELEMHACKNIHTLLGCRSAIADFVAMHKDEQGRPLVDDDEFDSALWDYECFRRTRLNWPSDVVDPYEDDPTNPSGYFTPEPISVKHSKSGSLPPVVENSDSFNGQYRRDELTHVRTIRVFHAVKSDEKSLISMFKSKSVSPKP